MTQEPNIVESKLKCPKCSCINLYITEIWKNHSIGWLQQDGKFDLNEGYMGVGNPYKVMAECDNCKHIWASRKSIQIDDIIKHITHDQANR
jgi:hypothetical protein